ncbi:MAG: 1-acyl-sn-glycerol-3-phosphate acyltransferase [Bacteroidetes bacterium]|nr:1-acyl-sn-glycerol-3-phosphate acyltransferase [Bacteroidota bacterium]
MLYQILKPLTNIFYRVFYRLDINRLKKAFNGKPLILSPNHTNAFIDPGIVLMTLPMTVRSFARGDVFKNRFAKWVLNDMKVSPVYRLREGYGELKKNDKMFEECRRLLSENKTLLLFPEAICIQEKRLQPLKKGLARIVFQTEELFDFKKEVFVVPIGLNYFDAKKFRSKLFINFGDPISINKYAEIYKQDKAKAINNFTKLLEKKMSELIIIINNKENDEIVAGINEIYLQDWMKERQYDLKSIKKQYYVGKEIAEMINYLDLANSIMLESLKKVILPYNRHLQKLKLRDHLLHPENINKMNMWNFLLDFLIIWFGIPLYFVGLVLNFPPYFISKKIADKKAENVEFYASVFANMAMVLWILYYGIQLLVVALVFRSWTFLGIYALLVPLTGLFVLKYYPIMKKIFGRWRLMRMVRKERKTVEDLIIERTSIITEIELAKKDYSDSLKIKLS